MFVIEIPFLDLDTMFDSNLTFGWDRLRPKKYVVIHKDKAVKIEQNKHRFMFNCSEQEFFDTWYDYFDLRTKYNIINHNTRRIDESFVDVAIRSKGIRLLNTDKFPTLIYSRIANNLGFEKAKDYTDHIAFQCGTRHTQSMREAGKVLWHEFPTPEQLLENIDELLLPEKVCSWLEKLCNAIINDGYDVAFVKTAIDKIFIRHDLNCFPKKHIADEVLRDFSCSLQTFNNEYLYKTKYRTFVYLYLVNNKNNPQRKGEIIWDF